MLSREWQKPEASGAGGNCAEVRISEDGLIEVRNDQCPTLGTAVFTPPEWAAFLISAKQGQFDLG